MINAQGYSIPRSVQRMRIIPRDVWRRAYARYTEWRKETTWQQTNAQAERAIAHAQAKRKARIHRNALRALRAAEPRC